MVHRIPYSGCFLYLQVEGTSNIEYQLKIGLYDLAYRQFFGKQWSGPFQVLQGIGGQSKPRLKYSQVIFFICNMPYLF